MEIRRRFFLNSSPMMKRAYLKTIGCKLNQAETSDYGDAFAAAGISIVREPAGADVIFLNTCAVTAKAASTSRHNAQRFASDFPGARLIIAGCWAELEPWTARTIQGAPAVIGTASRIDAQSVAALFQSFGGDAPPVHRSRERARPLLKIQDGCDQDCAYCIIPSLRGAPRSMPLETILEQTARYANDGAREIVLTGVRIGCWGKDSGEGSLPSLIEAILGISDGFRIRLGSLEPWELTTELTDLVLRHPRVCSHLHIPLQHTDPAILEEMRRPPLEDSLERIRSLAAADPTLAVGVDLISGFPGETAASFERSRSRVAALPLAYFHSFPYSPRPGTAASQRRGAPDPAEALKRAHSMRALSRELETAFLERQVGRTELVVPDLYAKEVGSVRGVTGNYIRLHLPCKSTDNGIVEAVVSPEIIERHR